MATRKVTITLDEAQLAAIRDMVDVGRAKSISGFVQHAVKTSLNNLEEWRAMLAEGLEQTGGPLTDDERRWADEVLGVKPPRRRRTPAA